MIFTEAERLIFQYDNGNPNGLMVFGDPLALQRGLTMATAGELPDLIAAFNQTENKMVRADAQAKLVDAVREAFQMVPFDSKTGMGALESLCLDTLESFLEFMDEKKTDGVTSPTLSPSTGSPLSAGETSPTKASSVSGPILKEFTANAPMP